MTNYREVKVWSGTQWEALALAYPDLTNYANKITDNNFSGTNTFSGKIIRPEQVPYNIEVGSVNLTTTTTGDSLIIGTKAFDMGRFTQTPIVFLTVEYPTTVKNGWGTVKTRSSSQFTYEVVVNVPVTDGQSPAYPLKLSYIAIQMTA
jgi:hypothetical protein